MRFSPHWIAPALLLAAHTARAQQQTDTPPSMTDTPEPVDDDTRPVLADEPRWVSPAVYSTAGLFLAATVIGPLVRARMPGTVPAADSHEEDPSADLPEPAR